MSNLPKIALITELGNTTDAQIGADLARIVGAQAQVDVVTRWDVPFTDRDDAMPRLIITRYEALQAARQSSPTQALDHLRLISPLYTEEVYILVRRDSPLTYIHEIENARMNLGPAGSTRPTTALRLYERMFGKSVAPQDASYLGDDEALGKLLGEKTLDAMFVVAAQPTKWLADLRPEVARELKLLAFDARHATAHKAVDAYLPSVVHAANYRTWLQQDVPTLATMSFLITTDSSDPAQSERVVEFARALCRSLPTLRREGHPKWREVDPSLDIDAGVPYLQSARSALMSCLGGAPAGTP